MTSKRLYAAIWFESGKPQNDMNIHLSEIIGTLNGNEYFHAMQDNIDPIMDLAVGEVLQMNFNRDDKETEGLVKRIR